MKTRQIALLASILYWWQHPKQYAGDAEEVIEMAKKFEDYLEYRRPPVEDIQDDPPIPVI